MVSGVQVAHRQRERVELSRERHPLTLMDSICCLLYPDPWRKGLEKDIKCLGRKVQKGMS